MNFIRKSRLTQNQVRRDSPRNTLSSMVHALNSDIVTDSQSTENISLFHAYARKNNMWILDQ